MAVPAHKTEYFIIEKSNLQKKAYTAKILTPPRRLSDIAYTTFYAEPRKMGRIGATAVVTPILLNFVL